MTELELGDVIRINAPSNYRINNKIFLITYLDETKMNTIEYDTLEEFSFNIQDGRFTDESIQSISLLARSKEKGYARQNNLTTGKWITIYLGGDLPTTLNGQIVDVEEDMIEVQLYPSNKKIYIDFGYKGIPQNLPIEKIAIRDPPIGTTKPQEEEEEEPYEELDKDASPALQDFILQADQIEFGEDLGEIEENIQVSEAERRYDIDSQTQDLLDELLSNIPSVKRTRKVLSNIQQIIERFQQLRIEFSEKTPDNYLTRPKKKDADYKPLVKRLLKLNADLFWILPVAYQKFDTEFKTYDFVENMVELQELYRNNELNEDHAYDGYIKKLLFFIDHKLTSESPKLIKQRVQEATQMIVQNANNLTKYVVRNGEEKQSRFVIQRYGLGFERPKPIPQKQLKIHPLETSKFKTLTPNDSANIQSMVLLDYPAIEYSRIYLPMTSLLSKISFEPKYHWTMLRQSTSITQEVLTPNILKNGINYEGEEGNSFLNEIKQIVVDESIPENKRYERFLNAIIPRTKELFNLIENSIQNKYSLTSILKSLEPFYIYQKDLTYTQYRTIVEFIDRAILQWKKSYEANRSLYKPQSGIYVGSLLLKSLFLQSDFDIVKDYEITYNLPMSGWSSVLIQDGASLVYSALSIMNQKLHNPNIENYLEQLDIPLNIGENMRVAKEYNSMDALKEDSTISELTQNRPLRYDAIHDKTRYDLVKELRKQVPDMSPDAFKGYLVQQLEGKLRDPYTDEILTGRKFEKEIEHMIRGFRQVEEGSHAILREQRIYKNSKGEDVVEKDEPQYFERTKDGRWKMIEKTDDLIDPDTLQQSIKYMAQKMINQFDKYMEEQTQSTYEKRLNQFKRYKRELAVYQEIKEKRHEKSVEMVERLAGLWKETHSGDIIQSPYRKLFQRILGEQDFSQKQYYILQFVDTYTYKGKNYHWRYCRETGKELVPQFMVELAEAYIQGGARLYQQVIEEICAKQGALSDGGGSIVDKHSGYIIRALDYDTEEGYDEQGFQIHSRDVLEDERDNVEFSREEEQEVRARRMRKLVSTEDGKYSMRVVNALLTAMGIPNHLTEEREFIVRQVINVIHQRLEPKEVYEKRVERGERKRSYESVRNEILMFSTLAYLAVVLQTITIQTRRTYPGCVRSFKGYPTEGSDLSSIHYIACVAYKMRTKANPWNSLLGMKEEKVQERVKQYVDKVVLEDPQMILRMEQPREEIENYIPEEQEVSNVWNMFLPPLKPPKINVSGLSNYKELLQEYIKSGSLKQTTLIEEIRGKALLYGLAVQDEIQNVLNKESSLLLNSNGEPYLQNVCCEGIENPFLYFEKHNSKVQEYNTKSEEYLDEIRKARVKAPIFYDPTDTKLKYPALSHTANEQIIYRAFIKYCKYNKDIPLDEEFTSVCQVNNSKFNHFDTIQEKIEILKSEGIEYNETSFKQLMNIVYRKNLIKINFEEKIENCRDSLLAVLENDKNEKIPEKLRRLIQDMLDTFDLTLNVKEDDKEYNNLLEYLLKSNKKYQTKIPKFIRENSSSNRSLLKKADTFIRKSINQWKNHITEQGSTMDTDDSTLSYIRPFFHTIIKELGRIIPEMIIKRIPMNPPKLLPKNWLEGPLKLGNRDETEIKEKLENNYSDFKAFVGSGNIEDVNYDEQGENAMSDKIADRSAIIGNQESALISPVLLALMKETKYIISFVKSIPFLATINQKSGQKVKSMFNAELVEELLLFNFYRICDLYIEYSKHSLSLNGEIINDIEPALASTRGQDKDEAQLIAEGAKTDTELDMVQGNTSNRKKSVANYLVACLSFFYDRKQIINVNYDEISQKILQLKEREKKRITDKLEAMSNDQRRAQNLMKNLRLEGWSAGQQKGLTQYVEKTQDKERQEAEQQIINEHKAMEQGAGEQNIDLFMLDVEKDKLAAQEIEEEAYDMSGLPEDDDYGNEEIFY
jgi:hypothetical protein